MHLSLQLKRRIAKAEHKPKKVSFHRRIDRPATGLQLQHLQPCVSRESRVEVVQLQAVLLPVHEWHVVFAGGAAVPGCEQLAAEHRHVWVRENLHRDCVHTEQLEEDQLVRQSLDLES